jgi:hypothetical protein
MRQKYSAGVKLHSPAAVFFFKVIRGSFCGISKKVLPADAWYATAGEQCLGGRFYEA